MSKLKRPKKAIFLNDNEKIKKIKKKVIKNGNLEAVNCLTIE